MRTLAVLLTLLTTLTFPAVGVATAAPECDDLTEWLPGDVIAYGKLHNVSKHIRALLDSDLRRDFEATQVGQFLKAQPQYQDALDEVDRFEEVSGTDPLKLIDDLFGREVVVAGRMGLFAPELVLLTRAKSVERLKAARKALERTIEQREGYLPVTEKAAHGKYTIEKAGDALFTYLGPVLAVSNSQAMIEQVIRLAEGESKNAVASSDAFSKVAKRGAGALLTIAARPEFIPNMDLPEKADSALASILLSGILGSLHASDLLTVSLDVEKDGLRLEIESADGDRGLDEKYGSFFPSTASSDLRSRLRKRGVLGYVELHRDFAQWWADSEKLLETQAHGGLAQFAQIMSLVFGGKDFQEDILPAIGDTVTLVVRHQSYAELDKAPQPAIPGLAAMLELDTAGEFGRQLEGAIQFVIGWVNIDRAQKKNLPPVRVKKKAIGDVEVSTVDLGLAAASADQPGIEHNFTPSFAVVGRRVVLSSSFELTRILVEELEKEPATPKTAVAKPARDRIVLDAQQIVKIVEQNLEFLASQNMASKGLTLDESRGEIGVGLELAALLRDLQILSYRSDDRMHVQARLRLAKRSGKKPGTTTKVNVR